MLSRHFSFLSLTIFLILLIPLTTHAETKVLTAEATYTMGDGETPSFAEAMALQKAKQMALEQAGTYVESYTKVQNYQLTADEIQTIAGGVLQVEVLEKKRELIGDGLRHYVKIKATVTTDKIADLAQRIKGKSVAEEYKQLQEEYVRLNKEIETWKQLIAKTPPGPERDKALDQIRTQEKAFAVARKKEAGIFQRLIEGKILAKTVRNDQDTLDRLAERIAEEHVISIGKAEGKVVPGNNELMQVIIPVRIKISDSLVPHATETVKTLGGIARTALIRLETRFQISPVDVSSFLIRVTEDHLVAEHFQHLVDGIALVFNLYDTKGIRGYCLLRTREWGKQKDKTDREKSIGYAKEKEWINLRRVFPVWAVNQDASPHEALHISAKDNFLHWHIPPPLNTTPDMLGYIAIVLEEVSFNVSVPLQPNEAETLKNITAKLITNGHLKNLKGQEYSCHVSQ